MRRFQYKPVAKGSRKMVLSVIVFIVVLAAFLGGLSSLSDKTLRRQKESLESALMRSITYCYIEEGAYPESLDYLREHYRFVYDEDLFYVDYHAAGANILPDFMIMEKRGK